MSEFDHVKVCPRPPHKYVHAYIDYLDQDFLSPVHHASLSDKLPFEGKKIPAKKMTSNMKKKTSREKKDTQKATILIL